jgi:hypothetical protein
MKVRSLYALPLIASALVGTGCQREGLYPVYGKVLYKGQPAAGATVYLHRDGGDGTSGDVVPMGMVASDGRFRIRSGDDDGAPPGMYKVLIEWLDQPTASRGGAERPAVAKKAARRVANVAWRPGPSRVRPPDRLKGRYFDIDRPIVRAEVGPSSDNTLPPIELTD